MAKAKPPTFADDVGDMAKKLAESFLPLSAIVSRVTAFGESIAAIRTPALYAVAAFKAITGESKKLAQGIGSVNAAFGELTNGLTSVASQLAQSVLLPIAPMQALAQVMTPFVAAFNPVVMEQFNLAITDVMAVIGSALTPVMTEVTKVVKEFGDLLIQSGVPEMFSDILMMIVEAIKPLIPVVLTLVEVLLQNVKVWLDVFAPVIKFVTDVLTELVKVIQWVQQAMYDLVQALMKMVPGGQRWRDRDFALERELQRKAKEGLTATGMGVRNVSVSSGGNALDALRQKMATSALKVGGNETLNVARQQLAYAKLQLDALNKMIKAAGGESKVPQAWLSEKDVLENKAKGWTDAGAEEWAKENQRIRQDGEGRGRRERMNKIKEEEEKRIAGQTGKSLSMLEQAIQKLAETAEEQRRAAEAMKRSQARMANDQAKLGT